MRGTLALAFALVAVLLAAPIARADDDSVEICHVPPGNPEAAHTIRVGAPAVEHHMSEHGDTLGPCDEDASESGGNEDDSSDPGTTNPGSGTNPGQPQGPVPSAVATTPAYWLWLLLIVLGGAAAATAYVLRRRRLRAR